MNDFLVRLKTDRILQIIVAGLLITVVALFFIFRPILFPKKVQTLCYRTTLKLWLPFREDQIYPYLSGFTKFCVNFKIETKSLEEIKNNLTLALASNEYPDIVFIDDEFLNKYPNFFATPTPIAVDSLVAYYNRDILNFFNLEQKPKTLDELKDFIQKTKNYQQNFYPIGLGTTEIRNRKEIILSLASLNPDFKDKYRLINNLLSALQIYKNFGNPQSEFFSYPEGAGDDLTNFANEKTALYLGFYGDKKEILSINPRINLDFDFYPLNTFPPKTKVYSKIFYLAPVRKSKNEANQNFILWFKKYQLKKFAQDFDLVPFIDDPDLPPEKKLIVNSVKNFGETFDFLNKKILFDNIDRILKANENELYRIIGEMYYSL